MPRGVAVSAALVTLGGLLFTPSIANAATSPVGTPASAPAVVGAQAGTGVDGEYVVVLKPEAAAAANEGVAESISDAAGGEVTEVFDTAIDGYSATLTAEEASAVAADPRVQSVEPVQTMVALAEQVSPPNWGDDRIDQRALPLDGRFVYPDSAGAGVHVYVIDSGIRGTHSEFAGRLGDGFDVTGAGQPYQDCNGHGTHVAGTAAGTTYGVAKKATVHSVRILGCNGKGPSDASLTAIEWIMENAQRPAVVNYSIGCLTACSYPALDEAVKNLIASGISWVQAAGNSNDNACLYSPQRVPEAVTVGNSTRQDVKYSTSSYGSCLDLWAPGTDIISSFHTSDTATKSLTGTSMASPHVAGSAALMLGERPSTTPAQITQALVGNATTGVLSGLDGASPSRLLYTGFLNPTTTTPTAVDLAALPDQTSTVGTAVDLAVTATGGTAPYTYSASGLPAGLSISATTGRITGTPTTAATSSVTVTVRDAASPATQDSVTFSWKVNASTTPPSTCTGTSVSSGTLASGAQAISATFSRTAAGTIEVCLDGPTGADFDAYLQKRSSSGTWTTVARGITTAPDEKFSYSATAGTYRVVVVSDSGSGAYTATVK